MDKALDILRHFSLFYSLGSTSRHLFLVPICSRTGELDEVKRTYFCKIRHLLMKRCSKRKQTGTWSFLFCVPGALREGAAKCVLPPFLLPLLLCYGEIYSALPNGRQPACRHQSTGGATRASSMLNASLSTAGVADLSQSQAALRMAAAAAALLLLLLATLQTGQAWVEYLKPPEGNSPHLRLKTSNGHHTYKCSCEKWKLVSASADLLSTSDSKSILGEYSYVLRPENSKHHGTWTLLNNPADAVESGAKVSTVTAKLILAYGSPGSLSEALFQATSHHFEGAAELVSYIQRLSPQGGVPSSPTCQTEHELLKLPFYAEYQMWRQDVVPPSVPQSLVVPSVKPVASFFGEGEVLYLFTGQTWEQKYAFAKLYMVPGGTKVGSYYIKAKPHESGTTHFWELSNPNGMQVMGKVQQPAVAVSNSSLPWTTTMITSRTGKNSMLKKAKAVQMVSTRGGVPTGRKPNKGKLSKGQLWRVPFSAVFWFYE